MSYREAPPEVPFPPGTWIGLRDRAGQKICVGDRVRIHVKWSKDLPVEHVVRFNLQECCFLLGPYHLGNGKLFETFEYEVVREEEPRILTINGNIVKL